MKKMKLINDTLMMSFTAVMMIATVTFGTLNIIENHKFHKKLLEELKKGTLTK